MLGRGVASTKWGREGTRGEKGPATIHRPFSPDGHRARVQSTPGPRGQPQTQSFLEPLTPRPTSGHKPQAATTCRPAQLGRWGPQMGTEGWGDPPRSSAPCWVSRKGGVPFPSPHKPQVPPATPGPLWSAGLFMLTLFSPQFKRSSQPQPSLRAQP